jgi:hypothetical protein
MVILVIVGDGRSDKLVESRVESASLIIAQIGYGGQNEIECGLYDLVLFRVKYDGLAKAKALIGVIFHWRIP